MYASQLESQQRFLRVKHRENHQVETSECKMKFVTKFPFFSLFATVLAVNQNYPKLDPGVAEKLLAAFKAKHMAWGFQNPVLVPFKPIDEALAKGWVVAIAQEDTAKFLPLSAEVKLPGNLVAMPVEAHQHNALDSLKPLTAMPGDPWVIMTLNLDGTPRQQAGQDHAAVLQRFHQERRAGTIAHLAAMFPDMIRL